MVVTSTAMTILRFDCITPLPPYRDSTHIVAMAKGPDRSRAPQARNPAKHSKKDPAKPTRAKAARPDTPALDPSLAELLNPGIAQGRAGIGAQTGIKSSPQRSPTRAGGPKETTSFSQTPTPTPGPSPQEARERDSERPP